MSYFLNVTIILGILKHKNRPVIQISGNMVNTQKQMTKLQILKMFSSKFSRILFFLERAHWAK